MIAAPAGRFTGRTAIVTGAAQGIGAAVATRFAREGAAVSLLDIAWERSAAHAAALREFGAEVSAVPCDVTDEHAVAAAVADHVGRLGRLDIVVSNAGINTYHDARTMTRDQWDRAVAIDLTAGWLIARATLPHLLERAGASIVALSSIHARATATGYFPYGALKAGVEGLVRGLALDFGPQGLRVNAVAPGWTRTPLAAAWFAAQDDRESEQRIIDAHPLRRLAEPEDIAAAVAFLCSDDARSITGTTLTVDNGLTARFAT